ncbi:McrB family protein [Bacteroides congonensis]|uniref:McrB family protein n=1 Tax=Bacteroides congonensis TaxID=1871006 RepID=UPI00189BBCBF|nr:AAA family ATPase [Bacteroides congonensis]
MKITPVSLIERGELNLRQGIKSSLNELRSIVAMLYAIYLASDKKAIIEYTQEYIHEGKTKITLNDELRNKLNSLFPGISNNSIDRVPIFTSQMEALQVGIELFLRLGKVTFVGSHPASSERTGGNRYNKVIKFGTNIKLIDLYLSAYTELQKEDLLNQWINNQDPSDETVSEGLKRILTIFSEETQFKIRTSIGEISFQQEGIYKGLVENKTVESNDVHELVGPYRIFKSYVKEGLHPYVEEDRTYGFKLKMPLNEEFESYQQLVSNSLDIIPKRTVITQLEYTSEEEENEFCNSTNHCLQQIFYGAPGTGKSHKVKQITKGKSKTVVTFHPDTDYSSFVGTYKPTLHEDGKTITYNFVPQAFAKAYVNAWKDTSKDYYLVIEEINRGNCAQIFGDIFQLLDRNSLGYSDYVIDVDKDFEDYLKKELSGVSDYPQKIMELSKDAGLEEDFSFAKIALPANLHIIATMNTSDQSLFPMDSAFKRRWDWQYLPIDYDKAKEIKIDIGGVQYNWGGFIEVVNRRIKEINNSEDKQLGTFFVKTLDGIISFDQFRSKVMFYLWFDIYKDEAGTGDSIFKQAEDDSKGFSFGDLFESNAIDIIKKFMAFLKVSPINSITTENEDINNAIV